MEEDITRLRAEVEQLKGMVEELVLEKLQNELNGNGANVGLGIPMMPVLGGSGSDGNTNGRYEIESLSVTESDEPSQNEGQNTYTASILFSNEYYSCGGKTYGGGEQPSSLTDVTLPAFIALKVDVTGSYPDADIVAYSSFAALQEAQEDEDYYIAPLYKIGSSGSVECDFRIGPVAAMFEFSTPEEE